MGVVFRAQDTLLDRPVARLTHPNVVAVYEVGTAGDELFVAMELVEGTTRRGATRRSTRC